MRTTAQRQERANIAARAVCGRSVSRGTYPLFSYVPRAAKRKSRNWKRVLRCVLWTVLAYYGLLAIALVLLRWIDPPTTAVQIERRMDAFIEHHAYRKRYSFVP